MLNLFQHPARRRHAGGELDPSLRWGDGCEELPRYPPPSVRAEPVEALPSSPSPKRKGKSFDRLRTNGAEVLPQRLIDIHTCLPIHVMLNLFQHPKTSRLAGGELALNQVQGDGPGGLWSLPQA